MPGDGFGDREPLVDDLRDDRPCHKKYKWCLIVSLALLLIAVGHAVAIYFIYFRCSEYNGCATLKIMALNTWGMPAAFGSEYKTQRMKAIANEFSKGHHDVYLFEELWMQPDHETVAAAAPKGFHMTGFRELALKDCDGRVSPLLCSGLAVATRLPVEEVEFNSFTWHGDAKKAFIDGEWLAKKGVGRVRVKVLGNVTVDLFVTHTAADPDQRLHNYSNAYYRDKQVKELMESYVGQSRADVVILGGDFNAGPVFKEGEPYHMVRSVMKNCIEDIFYKLNAWLNPDYATYGNKKNTFSNMFEPIIYDYIFHKTNSNDTSVWTNWFDIPFLRTKLFGLEGEAEKAEAAKEISLSDHEAVTSTIHIWKKK